MFRCISSPPPDLGWQLHCLPKRPSDSRRKVSHRFRLRPRTASCWRAGTRRLPTRRHPVSARRGRLARKPTPYAEDVARHGLSACGGRPAWSRPERRQGHQPARARRVHTGGGASSTSSGGSAGWASTRRNPPGNGIPRDLQITAIAANTATAARWKPLALPFRETAGANFTTW